jgi:hypothetical protein
MARYALDYLKVREEVDKMGGTYFRIWTPEKIEIVYIKQTLETIQKYNRYCR